VNHEITLFPILELGIDHQGNERNGHGIPQDDREKVLHYAVRQPEHPAKKEHQTKGQADLPRAFQAVKAPYLGYKSDGNQGSSYEAKHVLQSETYGCAPFCLHPPVFAWPDLA
jgi:hypothetical protein